MTRQPARRITLDEDLALRQFGVGDAALVARAVRESLDHLRPWMPWADDESGNDVFQRRRLRGVQHKAVMGEEWQYGLWRDRESVVLGSFGLMARKWPATIEIGYWVHVDAINAGLATRASRALTNEALGLEGITTVCIRCDEANVRSAAVPRKLGFELVRTETRQPQAPGESGRLMVWARTEPIV